MTQRTRLAPGSMCPTRPTCSTNHCSRPESEPRTPAPRPTTASRVHLHRDVGGFDDGDRTVTFVEVEVVDRFARQQRDEAVRACLHLDLGGDVAADHPG